jgi:hypothetical protein
MKRIIAVCRIGAATAVLGATCLLPLPAQAQAIISSWQTNRSTQFAQVREYVGGALVTTWPSPGFTTQTGNQSTPAQSDIQQIWATPLDVFVYSNDLASHTMGPWYNNSAAPTTATIAPRWPISQNLLYKFPRTPSNPVTTSSVGAEAGFTVHGVAIFNWGDAFSYNGGTNEATNGAGIWNRLAYPEEGKSFDPAMAHATPTNGSYHHHSNPYGLRYQLNDNVSLAAGNANTLEKYSEDISNLHHSPILGWAYDGLPIYGPYGYSDPLDSNSTVTRMISGFVLRDGTNGTTNLKTNSPAATGRTSLPYWAQLTQNKTTLTPAQYGPATWATVGTGPGAATASLGRYAEDYDHLSDTGNPANVTYHLDRYNHRFCKTPEFPSGVDAYFVTINADGTPAFPNMLAGQCFKAKNGQKVTNGTPPGTASLLFTAIKGNVLDGSAAELNYTINPTAGSTDQALGRFALSPNSNGHITHTSYTVNLGSVAGISNLKLYYTTTNTLTGQVQFGSTVASPSGSVTFTDTYTTSAITYFWLRGDVSAGAAGTLDARLTNVGVTGVNAASFAGNDALANSTKTFSSGGYTWNGSVSTDYQVAANWTPTRTTPTTSDDLTINGSVTASPTITNVPDQTIHTLTLTNSATATLTGSASNALTFSSVVSPLTIDAGSTLQIGSNLYLFLGNSTSISGNLTIQSGGTLVCSGGVLSGTGAFSLSAGASLSVNDADGIAASGSTGQIQTAARTFSTAGSYQFSGAGSQVTGSGLPSAVAALNANATAGLTLSSDVFVTGGFSVNANRSFSTGANTLSLGGSASVASNGSIYVPSGGQVSAGVVQIIGAAGSSFALDSGGTLVTSDLNGISSAGSTGAIQTDTRSFSVGSNYTFNRNGNQDAGNGLPASVNNLTVAVTAGLTLASDVTVNGALSIQAGLLVGSHTITLNGSASVSGFGPSVSVASGGRINTNGVTIVNGGAFVSGFSLASGATFETKNAGGLSGAVQVGSISINPGANFIFDGTSAQVTGSAVPGTINQLTIDNPTTVTLSQATTATQQLVLSQGVLDTNGNALVVNTDGDSAVTVSGTSYIKGAITRYFDRSVSGAFRLYPVGTTAYAGVDIVETPGTGTGYITVSTTDGDPPNALSPAGVLDRYWTVTATGFDPAGCQLQFHYLQSDVTGTLNENAMVLTRYSGGGWTEFTPDYRDTTSNIIMKASLPGFSIWSAANAAAVPVNLSRFSAE